MDMGDGKTKELTNKEVKNVIQNLYKKIGELEKKVGELLIENDSLKRKINFKNRNKK
jgi:regulator of replication initiation timing